MKNIKNAKKQTNKMQKKITYTDWFSFTKSQKK